MAEKLCQLKKKGGGNGSGTDSVLVEGRFFGKHSTSTFILRDNTTGLVTSPYAINCLLNGKYSKLTSSGYGSVDVWHKDGTHTHYSPGPGGSVTLGSNDVMLCLVAFSTNITSTYTLQ